MREETRHQELDAEKILETIQKLSTRIEQRFPGSGLLGVSEKLCEVAHRTQARADWITKPNLFLRTGIGVLFVLLIVLIAGAVTSFTVNVNKPTIWQFLQSLEAGINDIVLAGVAVFFLFTLERRLKRRRALKAIHELRALAHIIDMHQLTKDPDRLAWQKHGIIKMQKTDLTPFKLTRYLDYCSEMLSLVGKLAVLYVQRFNDPVVLTAVNEIESLSTGLSRKIWQKLIILHGGNLLRGNREDIA